MIKRKNSLVTCPKCMGTKIFIYTDPDSINVFVPYNSIPCQKCDGTGKVLKKSPWNNTEQ